jgi:hypothetical protein
LGDIPAWVEHLAVSVPGTEANTTSVSDVRAERLAAATRYDKTVVFQWAGGAFPQDIPEAMNASQAHAFAPRLASFTNGMDVPVKADVTLIGHSYGGAAVGLAEAAGMKADKIVYAAAAGLGQGNDTLADFPNTHDKPHYAVMARNDAVVGLIQPEFAEFMHGQSTVRMDGVIRLETGLINENNPDQGWVEEAGPIEAHSVIFDPESTALKGMVQVIVDGEARTWIPEREWKALRASGGSFDNHGPE